MSYMQHHLNVDIAKKFGVNVAIFMDHMAFWNQKNMANNHHFYDGAYWTYNSVEAFKKIFPYWTTRQMRKVIDDCAKHGLVQKGNYNDKGYDKKMWYSLTKEGAEALSLLICQKGQMDLSKRANGFVKKGKPIADTNTDTNTDKIKSVCATKSVAPVRFEEFWLVYPRKKDKKRAQSIWQRDNLDEKADELIKDVKNRILNDHTWREDGYIPFPKRYLDEALWTNEITLISFKQKNEKFNPVEYALQRRARRLNSESKGIA